LSFELSEALAPLKSRHFRVYWIGQAVSLIGTWMQQMAQGWVVTRLTSSASALGMLALATSLPMMVLGLKGGQLADRLNKRNILITTQALLALLALAFAGLAFSGVLSLWHVFVLTVLLGITTAFDLPAAQAFGAELVEPRLIARAVALIQSIFHGSRLLGPALAGVLVERLGEGSAFLANSISFLAVLASLLSIPADYRDPERHTKKPDQSLGAGFRYVRKDSVAGGLMVLLLLAMSLIFPFVIVLMVYYAKHVIYAGAAGMGGLMSASGCGALAGAAFLILTGIKAWRRTLFVGLGIATLALLGLSMNRALWSAVVLNATLSLGVSLYMGTISQVIQQRVPDEIRGRVMALFGIAFTSVMPVSALLLSLLADVVGLRTLMAAAAGLFATLGLVQLFRLRAVG